MKGVHSTVESYKILKDLTGSYTNPIKALLILVMILWDLRQDFERLNSILSIRPLGYTNEL